MWEMQFLQQLYFIVLALGNTTGGPFSHPIHRKNGRLLKRGRKKRTGRVRLMMLAKQNRPLIVQVFADIGPGP